MFKYLCSERERVCNDILERWTSKICMQKRLEKNMNLELGEFIGYL